VDKETKNRRLADARKALGKPYEKPAPTATKLPFKKMHKLKDMGEEECALYAVPVTASSCLVKEGPAYKPTQKRMKPANIDFWAVHFEYVDECVSDDLWVGSNLNPGYGDAAKYWDSSESDTPDEVAVKLIESGGIGTYTEPDGFNKGFSHEIDNSTVVVSQSVWEAMSIPVRERFMREIFADDVYIKMTPYWE
jgi:hypothetical protein